MLINPPRTRRFLLAGALCAALVGTGCGEDDTEKYRDDFNEAAESFESELKEASATMRAAGRAKSREQYGRGVEQLQSAGEDFRDQLEDLDPPEDAKDEQDDLDQAIDEFSTAVGSINAAVQSDDEDAIRAEASRVQTAGRAVDDAIKDVREAVE
jgi:hypothetical protein